MKRLLLARMLVLPGLMLPGSVFAQTKAEIAKAKLPNGAGKETTARVCGVCHSVEVSTSARESREGWNAIVVNMVERGAKGTDDEFGEVVDYLAEHFPIGAPGGKVNVNTATAAELQNTLELTPEQAASVLKYRNEQGKLKSFDDLGKVPGIDLAKLAPKKALVTF